jgi:hypothetical protein
MTLAGWWVWCGVSPDSTPSSAGSSTVWREFADNDLDCGLEDNGFWRRTELRVGRYSLLVLEYYGDCSITISETNQDNKMVGNVLQALVRGLGTWIW